jgi:hypothetical protein
MFATLLLLATPAFAVELFRYRGAAKDGATLEYIFETDVMTLKGLMATIAGFRAASSSPFQDG